MKQMEWISWQFFLSFLETGSDYFGLENSWLRNDFYFYFMLRTDLFLA